MFQISFFNKLRVPCYVLLISILPGSLYGQASTDSLTKITEYSTTVKKKPLKIVAPALMMGVGALALENHLLQDINRTVRYHVLATNPNVNNTLEDGLRHIPLASAFVVLPLLGAKSESKFIDKVMVYAIATTLADQTVARLKTETKSQRPDGTDRRSFPSGHTATAFMSAEFLRKEYGETMPWAAVIGYTAATATGALRVYHNKHWLTDVVAGAGLGILSTNLAYLIHSKTTKLSHRVMSSKKLTMLPGYQQKTMSLSLIYRPN